MNKTEWKYISGYRYNYRINRDAVVERQTESGKWKALTPVSTNGAATVNLAAYPKGFKRVTVISLMEGRWMPKRKRGEVYRRIDGNSMNCACYNLQLTTRKKIACRLGGPGRRPVRKVAPDGTILEVYRSAGAAAKAHFIDRKCVVRRCRGQIQNPFDLLGFSFEYDDDRRVHKVKR